MPIEFSCTTCGQLVRTPETAAGKKGKCPHCASIVQIPLASQASGVGGQGAGQRNQASGAGGHAAGAEISFPCDSCGQTVRTPMAAAGKKGKCPHCQAVVQIPGGSPPAAARLPLAQPIKRTPAAPQPTSHWKGTPRPAQPAAPAPPARPRPVTRAAEAVEEIPTLTPIDSPSGLTPLGPVLPSGLTPLAAGPVGGGPLGRGDDPLAGLTSVHVSGQTLGPSNFVPNPYASPAGSGAYSSAASYGFEAISDSGRKGLPWERRADMESFQDTAMLILGEPQIAFPQMRRTGGLMNAMLFWMIAALIGVLATRIYISLFLFISLLINNAPAEAYGAAAMVSGIFLVGDLIGVLILAPIGSFLGAALWHVVLLVFGCARGGFEATYRAQCFVGGGVILLNVIPVVGPLVGLFYAIALLIQAFTHAHEAPGGRVAAAVLTTYGLLCCCLAPLVVLAGMSLLSAGMAGGMPRGF